MSDYYNGQIYGWNGGECPVHPIDVVTVWCWGGDVKTLLAESVSWDHAEAHHFGRKDDIIAFKVVKRHVEPKVIWVNEYNTGFYSPYLTKEEAVKMASIPQATRIAVKYVEARDE